MRSMQSMKMRWILGSMSLVLLACDPAPDDEDLAFREVVPVEGMGFGAWPPPGGTFNTASLGVTPLMRILPPAYDFDGPIKADDGVISLIEVLDGGDYVPVTGVSVPGGRLVLETARGPFEGAAVEGSRWWLDAAKTQHIVITEVSLAGTALGYQLEHRVVGKPEAQPVCAPDIDGDHWAYLVEDVLVDVTDGSVERDDGPLLVACASGALGKAITWGFSPWQDKLVDPLLLYQTGVRTVMADYCGNGSSYTEDGILIQVSNDAAGQRFSAPSASTEAVFGPDGALCLTTPRKPGLPTDCALAPCTDKLEGLMAASYHTWTKLAAP
jgi:hypothetical protein